MDASYNPFSRPQGNTPVSSAETSGAPAPNTPAPNMPAPNMSAPNTLAPNTPVVTNTIASVSGSRFPFSSRRPSGVRPAGSMVVSGGISSTQQVNSAAQDIVISSGTGDVVLDGGKKSKKKRIIAGVVAGAVAIGCAVAAVIILNWGSAEEEYTNINSVLFDHSFDVYDANDLIEDGYDHGYSLSGFFNKESLDTVNESKEKLAALSEKVSKFSYKKISDENRALVKDLMSVKAPAYFSLMDSILGKLGDLIGAYLNEDMDGVASLLAEYGITSSDLSTTVSALEAKIRYEQKKGLCTNNNSEECNALRNEYYNYFLVSSYGTDTIKTIFRHFVNEDVLKQMDDFSSTMNRVRNIAGGALYTGQDEIQTDGEE